MWERGDLIADIALMYGLQPEAMADLIEQFSIEYPDTFKSRAGMTTVQVTVVRLATSVGIKSRIFEASRERRVHSIPIARFARMRKPVEPVKAIKMRKPSLAPSRS